MTKRNKITFLIAEALLAVLAAYFFYSIFHGDVPPKKVAVIVENSGDKRWDSLLNGMKQAAKVQNLSLIICNTDEQESSEDEQEMIYYQPCSGTGYEAGFRAAAGNETVCADHAGYLQL